MKEATIQLRLDKNMEVTKRNVTTVEALFLTAEHQKNAGGAPVTVDKTTIKDAMSVGADGKPHLRTLDEELDRLRSIYHPDKLTGVLNQVRELPGDDFEKAVQRGMAVVAPTTKAPEFKLI